MTITVEIAPEIEAKLAARAAERGLDVSAYAAELLAQATQPYESSNSTQSFLEFLRSSPLVGAELDLERDKDTGRDIEL